MNWKPATGRRASGNVMIAAAMLVFGGCSSLEAQSSLAGRVSSAAEGRVQFSFPARPGVCGDGRSFVSVDGSMHFGTFLSTESARAACATGPVRVVIDRADRQVIGMQTYVGPLDAASAAPTDLGQVTAREAADYLLDLAATLDGRPSRDAIFPAAIADGVDASARLVAIARNGARPNDTRRSAMSWLAREADTPDAARRASGILVELARDDAQPRTVRQGALSVLSRLQSGEGIPAVISLARAGSDSWLSREAVAALARSGDPRARESTREVVQQGNMSDEVVAVAVRGLSGEYGTAQDAELIRRAYPRLPGEASRRAALNALAERGGDENARWLLQVASDGTERESVRRQALTHARRAGASSAELAQLYDRGDNAVRSAVVSALAQDPDQAALDKLLAIARSGDDRTLRRRAINALAKVDDPKVKAALTEIVER